MIAERESKKRIFSTILNHFVPGFGSSGVSRFFAAFLFHSFAFVIYLEADQTLGSWVNYEILRIRSFAPVG